MRLKDRITIDYLFDCYGIVLLLKNKPKYNKFGITNNITTIRGFSKIDDAKYFVDKYLNSI